MPDPATAWRQVAFGLGGNLGNPAATIREAVSLLDNLDAVRIEAVSPIYRTPPWGPVTQPHFANACALGRSTLAPEELLLELKAIESRLGRQAGIRWGPRAIDIDILWIDGQERSTPELELPHPGLFERAFVLVPLADIAPDLVIAGRRIASAVEDLDRSAIERWVHER